MTSSTPLYKTNPDYLGQVLISRGFRDWFLYMFRVIEGRPFIVEPVHEKLFTEIEAFHNLNILRENINVPPRSSKTTLAKWVMIYSLTLDPKCNFIYTSYSQSLLNSIARETANILEHPIYKAMYPVIRAKTEEEIIDPVDDYWREYLKNVDRDKEKKNTYSNNKIITVEGGTILFASIGAQITGFGCGRRGASGFSGMLICDDANKPADIHSVLLREKVHRYYDETLLSRLNDSNVPVLNIQQRLHQEDLSGYLEAKYNFRTLKEPLIDKDGHCQLPSQYNDERIAELQKNNFMFQSQYQQQPILEGGNLIKTEWFQRYTTPLQAYKQLFICCDTAFSEKQSADYTVFGLFGLDDKNHIWLLDMYRKHVIFPDMVRDLKSFYKKALDNYSRYSPFGSIYIENKASGQSLIQQLRQEGLPIKELYPTIKIKGAKQEKTADKYTRFMEVSADLESGYMHIPESASWLLDFISECEAFTGGTQNEHDDICDACCIYPLKVRREFEQPDWEAFRLAFR